MGNYANLTNSLKAQRAHLIRNTNVIEQVFFWVPFLSQFFHQQEPGSSDELIAGESSKHEQSFLKIH